MRVGIGVACEGVGMNKEGLKRIGNCVPVMDQRFAPLAANTEMGDHQGRQSPTV